MATLSEQQADAYLDARPTYPRHWYEMIAKKTAHHCRAWDAGTGNGQAAIGVAEYYTKVVATDNNERQLERAMKHPRVTYFLTPSSMSEDEMVNLIGGENSVDLVTAAQAVHYFDLSKFYAVVKRVLRKPGGVIAVWVYNDLIISRKVDRVMKRLVDSTLPYRTPIMKLAFEGYKTLSFPFESLGLGSEGHPMELEIPKKLSLNGFLGFLRSWQPVVKAKEQGAKLLTESLIKEFEAAWGKTTPVKDVVYKAFMIAGKVASNESSSCKNWWANTLPPFGFQPPPPFGMPPPPSGFPQQPFGFPPPPPPSPPYAYRNNRRPPPPPFGMPPPPSGFPQQPFGFPPPPPPPPFW